MKPKIFTICTITHKLCQPLDLQPLKFVFYEYLMAGEMLYVKTKFYF